MSLVLLPHITTPSIPNYKTSRESLKVKAISSLIKIIERNIKIYDIKLMYYENITNKKSNGTHSVRCAVAGADLL